MPIYKNNRVQRVFRGDHKPVRIYRGANKIAGWEESTATGQNVTVEHTYNDAAHVEVQGNTELQSDYMECWGGSAQDGTPTLDAPITITPRVAAGTYKITTDYGIYEVTLPDLHGIGDVKDKIVFDALSGKGYSICNIASKILDGTENHIWLEANSNDESNLYGCTVRGQGGTSTTQLCSHFAVGSCVKVSYTESLACGNPEGFMEYFRVRKDTGITTLDEWKAYVVEQHTAGTPLNIIYQAATPIRTHLTFTKVAASTAPELPLKAFGKNLVDFEWCLKKWGATYERIGDKFTISHIGKGYHQPIKLFDASTVVSCQGIMTDVSTVGARIDFMNNGINQASIKSNASNVNSISCTHIRLNYSTIGTFSVENFQLELGDTVTDYEAFNPTPPNSAEPSPDYPQEIVPASGRLRTEGRNLFDASMGFQVSDRYDAAHVGGAFHLTPNPSVATPAYAFTNAVLEIPADGIYTASVEVKRDDPTIQTGGVRIIKNGRTLVYFCYPEGEGFTSDASSFSAAAGDVIQVSVYMSVADLNVPITGVWVRKLQIERGGEALAYAPYQAPSSVEAPTLYGIKTADGSWAARDELTIGEDGSVQVLRRVKVLALTGTEYWYLSANEAYPSFYIAIDGGNPVGAQEAMCSHYPYVLRAYNTQYGAMCIDSTCKYVWFSTANIYSTIDDWKAYLADQYANGTPVTIAYELATPTVETIEGTAAKTYYPQTVIELTSNLPMDMATKYKHF